MIIKTKRVYDPYDVSDGFRILVDRLWPRGVSKEKGKIDFWAKDLAPSNELRKWYRHEIDKWDQFKKKYFLELDNNAALVKSLMKEMQSYPIVTFLYSSKEKAINNAEAFRLYLNNKINK